MRLFEAIIDANHRAVAGDKEAGLHPADFENELPVIALTCIDPRLNAFFPNVLALPADQFIWLRNAGNIIFDPMSSMMRTLALACAVKGGKEIAIIGHTDCQVGKTTTMQLLERFKELGVERHLLPDNLNEFFGLFSSERQNVIKSCDIVRHSPLIGPKIPVHGLLLNIETGELDWMVNGYQTLDTMASRLNEPISPAGAVPDHDEIAVAFPPRRDEISRRQNRRAGDESAGLAVEASRENRYVGTGNAAQRRVGGRSGGESCPTGRSICRKTLAEAANDAAENSHPAAHPADQTALIHFRTDELYESLT